MAYSNEGRNLVTVDESLFVAWEIATGKRLYELPHNTDDAHPTELSPDGRLIFLGQGEGTVNVHDGSTGGLLGTIAHDGSIDNLSVSDDGTALLAFSHEWLAGKERSSPITVWNTATLQPVNDLPLPRPEIDEPLSPRLSSKGQFVLLQVNDRKAEVWDVARGSRLQVIDTDSEISNFNFNADGKLFLIAAGSEVHVWGTESGRHFRGLSHQSEVYDAVFLDGSLVIGSTTDDNTIHLWDLENSIEIASRQVADTILGSKFSSDGDSVIWSGLSGAELISLRSGIQGEIKQTGRFGDDVHRVNDSIFAIRHDRVNKITVWNSKTSSSKVIENSEYTGEIINGPKGQRFATLSDSRTKIWNSESVEAVRTVRPSGHVAGQFVFSPNGNYAATRSKDFEGGVWNLESGETVAVLGHDPWQFQAAMSPDNTQLVVAAGGLTAQIWSAVDDMTLMSELNHDAVISALGYSPDGTRVATASWDRTAKLWNPQDGSLVATLSHDNKMSDLFFDADGERIATVSWDGTIAVWDTATGNVVARLDHPARVNAANFSPDGNYLVSALDDGLVRIWDLQTREVVWENTYNRGVHSASFSVSGQLLLLAGSDAVWLIERHSGSVTQHLDFKSLVWNEYYYSDREPEWTESSNESFHQFYSLREAVLSPDDSKILLRCDNLLWQWDLADDGPRNIVPDYDHYRVFSAAYGPGGDTIVASIGDLRPDMIWDANTLEKLGAVGDPDRYTGHSPHISYSQDGQFLIRLFRYVGEKVEIWNAGSLTKTAEITIEAGPEIRHLAFTGDSQFLRTYEAAGESLWDIAKGTRVEMTPRPEFPWANVALNGGFVMRSMGLGSSKTALYGPDSDQPIATLPGAGFSSLFDVTVDGKYAITQPYDELNDLQIWSLEATTIVGTHKIDGFVTEVHYDASGRNAVVILLKEQAPDFIKTALFLDLVSGQLIETWSTTSPIRNITYSSSGDLALIEAMEQVVVFSFEEKGIQGEIVHPDRIGNGTALVKSARLSVSDQYIITAGSDGTARIWSTDTLEMIAVLPHDNIVDAAFLEGDHSIMTVSATDTSFSVTNSFSGNRWRLSDSKGAIRYWKFAPLGDLISSADSWLPVVVEPRDQQQKK